MNNNSISIGQTFRGTIRSSLEPTTQLKDMGELEKFLVDVNATLYKNSYGENIIEIKEPNAWMSLQNTAFINGKRLDVILKVSSSSAGLVANKTSFNITVTTHSGKFAVEIPLSLLAELIQSGKFNGSSIASQIPSATSSVYQIAKMSIPQKVPTTTTPAIKTESVRQIDNQVVTEDILETGNVVLKVNHSVLESRVIVESDIFLNNVKATHFIKTTKGSVTAESCILDRISCMGKIILKSCIVSDAVLTIPMKSRCEIDLTDSSIEGDLTILDRRDTVEEALNNRTLSVSIFPPTFNYPTKNYLGQPPEGAWGRIEGILHKYENGQFINCVDLVIKGGVIKGDVVFQKIKGRIILEDGAKIVGRIQDGEIIVK